MHRRNRHSASNRGENTWHYHHQQPDLGRTRWWNNTKSSQEAVSPATTQTIRHSRWRPSDGIYNGGSAYSGISMSSMVDLTHIGSPKWYGELVQRRAMNIIYTNTPYIEALANAQLTSLKQRRAQLCEHFFTQIKQPQHKLHKLQLYYQNQGLQHTIHNVVLDTLYPE